MNDTLEANFNIAMNLSEAEYTYSDLLGFLSGDSVVEKQFAALNLAEIRSREDAEILVSNLVGQDGKVREAVAFKVNEFVADSRFSDFFVSDKIYSIFSQGIMDINGNVCRQIVDILAMDNKFKQFLANELPKMLSNIWQQIEELDLSAKQYVVSKRNFQLYWCLEALYNIIEITDLSRFKDILFNCAGFYDYTIREKIAKILTKVDDLEFAEVKTKLKNDENYYVRRYL